MMLEVQYDVGGATSRLPSKQGAMLSQLIEIAELQVARPREVCPRQ
jgi:hypothetical protein